MPTEFANVARATVEKLAQYSPFASESSGTTKGIKAAATTVATEAAKGASDVMRRPLSSNSSSTVTPSNQSQSSSASATITSTARSRTRNLRPHSPFASKTPYTTKATKAANATTLNHTPSTPGSAAQHPRTTTTKATPAPKTFRAVPRKPKSPPTFDPFPRLPLELREQIYLQATLAHNRSSFTTRIYADAARNQHGILHLKICLPPVCFTARVEGRIAAAVLVRYATFYLYRNDDVDVMREWLGKWRLGGVCHLEVFPSVNYREKRVGRDVEFMVGCEGLQNLRTYFPFSFYI
jgi:hypothetical protein